LDHDHNPEKKDPTYLLRRDLSALCRYSIRLIQVLDRHEIDPVERAY
jgi:hypothetical protein